MLPIPSHHLFTNNMTNQSYTIAETYQEWILIYSLPGIFIMFWHVFFFCTFCSIFNNTVSPRPFLFSPYFSLFSFFKTIIMFVLAACLVITSDHDCLHQHGILSVLRKQLRSRVGKGLLVEAQLAQTPARTFVQRVPVALGNISSEDCSSDVVNCKGEDPHSGGV